MHDRRHRCGALTIALVLCLFVLDACSVGGRVRPPRSAWEQILSSTAIDRALARLDWPEVAERSVLVVLGAPHEGQNSPTDREYLLRSVQVEMIDRGAVVVTERERADLLLTVLVGALGINIGGRFMGLEGTDGGIFPFTIPELALYKRTRREAFARTELVLVDNREGGILHRSGPIQGSAQRTTTTVLLVFRTVDSDLDPLDEPPEESSGQEPLD